MPSSVRYLKRKGHWYPTGIKMLLTKEKRLQKLRKGDKQRASGKQIEVSRGQGEEHFVTRQKKINIIAEFSLHLCS